MINNRKDLQTYLAADKESLGINRNRPKFMSDFEWRYEIVLRKAEYYYNRKKLMRFYYLFKLRRLQLKYMTFIPINVCGKGLSIAHVGGIRINSNSKLGEYCRIQEGVTIGATNGSTNSPKIGDYVYIGSGAKIIGDISICNNVAIGAGAVVIKDCNIVGTYGGVPAKLISHNDSKSNLLRVKI